MLQQQHVSILSAPFHNQHTCIIVPNFLSPLECQELISKSVQLGFGSAHTHYPPSYRNNDRLLVDDTKLSERMTSKLLQAVPEIGTLICDSTCWQLQHVNERFRFCRYLPNQQFFIHQDGVHFKSANTKSRLTFMIYLNDAKVEFTGGDTVFYSAGPSTVEPPQEIGRYTPQQGSLIVFDHSLWHAGELVTSGTKYVMRSDLIYTLKEEQVTTSEGDTVVKPFSPCHNGYIWKMVSCWNKKYIATGGRDTRIKIWNPVSKTLQCELLGHKQSVLGLASLGENQLVSVSRDRTIRIWNQDMQLVIKEDAHEGTILCVAVSSDNERIATGGADAKIKIWDTKLQLQAVLQNHTSWVWCLLWSGSHLYSASEDGTLCHFENLQFKGQMIHGKPLRCASIIDNNTIACGDVHGHIALFSTTSYQLQSSFQAHDTAIRSIHIWKNNYLVSTSEDFFVKVWDMAQPKPEAVSSYKHANFVTDTLQTSEDEFLSCSYDGTIQMHQF